MLFTLVCFKKRKGDAEYNAMLTNMDTGILRLLGSVCIETPQIAYQHVLKEMQHTPAFVI
ncbi:hypothetical protein MASR1M90_06300 [Desulfovibrionales bacterium]